MRRGVFSFSTSSFPVQHVQVAGFEVWQCKVAAGAVCREAPILISRWLATYFLLLSGKGQMLLREWYCGGWEAVPISFVGKKTKMLTSYSSLESPESAWLCNRDWRTWPCFCLARLVAWILWLYGEVLTLNLRFPLELMFTVVSAKADPVSAQVQQFAVDALDMLVPQVLEQIVAFGLEVLADRRRVYV